MYEIGTVYIYSFSFKGKFTGGEGGYLREYLEPPTGLSVELESEKVNLFWTGYEEFLSQPLV